MYKLEDLDQDTEDEEPPENVYSQWMAGIIVLNMVLGSGPILLPYSFEEAGLVFAAAFLACVALIGYVTITFVVETMSICNALTRRKERADGRVGSHGASLLTDHTLVEMASFSIAEDDDDDFEIADQIEIGAMARMLLNKPWQILTYVAFIAYTYGCLSLYAVMLGKSMETMVFGQGATGTAREIWGIRGYYIFVLGFAIIVIPFTLGTFKNTRIIQWVTIVVRFVVFGFMLYTTGAYLVEDPYWCVSPKTDSGASGCSSWNKDQATCEAHEDTKGNSCSWEPHISKPTIIDISGISVLYGNMIFTFMIHHSIPAITTPIRPRNKVKCTFGVTYATTVTLYIILCGLAMFAFGSLSEKTKCTKDMDVCPINELYNLNWANYHWKWLAVFMDSYPVLVVALYPLVAISLRNNVRDIAANSCRVSPDSMCTHVASAMTAGIPPILIALATDDVDMITKYVGAYAGLGLMFLIPTRLVSVARQRALDEGIHEERLQRNPQKSPFTGSSSSSACVYFIYLWVIICVVYATTNFILQAADSPAPSPSPAHPSIVPTQGPAIHFTFWAPD